MKFSRARDHGFTLVEVMVALTVLSLVMLATITGLRTLASTQGALERVTRRVDEVRSVSSFLRDAFENIVLGSGSSGELTAGGSGRDLTFFRVLPRGVEWKSIILFGENFGGSYLLKVSKEGDAMVLRWLEPKALTSSLDWKSAPSRVLVEKVDDVQVSYRRDGVSNWSKKWDKKDVPSLLRMEIKASDRYWPELVFRLR